MLQSTPFSRKEWKIIVWQFFFGICPYTQKCKHILKDPETTLQMVTNKALLEFQFLLQNRRNSVFIRVSDNSTLV